MIQEPIQPTPEAAARRRPHSATLRILVVVGLVLLLAVPVAMAMAANDRPAVPVSVLTAGASAVPDNLVQPKVEKGPKANKGNGPNGPKQKGPGKGPVTITSISGNDVALATEDGWTRTITVTSATTITKAGQTITVGDLAVGDEVAFRQVRNDDGSYTITAIQVRVPHVGGEVSAVTDDSITVKGKGGTTKVITVTGSTVYKVGAADGTKADVTVGSKIEAAGTVSGDTFTASVVTVRPAHVPHAMGEVTAKTGDSITIKDKDGKTTVIHVTSDTTYKVRGNKTASLADISVGGRVQAQGTWRSDGSLDAVAVHGGMGKPDKAPKAPKAPKTP